MPEANIESAGQVRDVFFEAAIGATSLENALDALTSLFGAVGSTLLISDKELKRPSAGWIAGKFDPKGMESYLAYYGRLDPLVPLFMSGRPAGELISYEQVVSEEFVRRSEFFQDFLIPFGGRHLTCGSMFEDSAEVVTLAVQTGVDKGPFRPEEIALLQYMWPSLATAIQVFRKLATANINSGIARLSGMLDAFEQMACAGVLVDQFGRVLRMNPRAERYLNDSIRIEKGRLFARHRKSDTNLQRLIATATSRRNELACETVITIARPSGRPLIAYFMPVQGFENSGPKSPAAIILLADPDADRPPADRVLSQVFGLSAAEIRLANLIMRGLSTKDAADQLSIGYETARTELKTIFQKTGVHRQAEFVALLGRIAVPSDAHSSGR